MVNVTFVDAAGASRTIDARPGATLMETAIENAVPSIVGFCGRMCGCGTCHRYVAPGLDGLRVERPARQRNPWFPGSDRAVAAAIPARARSAPVRGTTARAPPRAPRAP
jgi:ferredoxin